MRADGDTPAATAACRAAAAAVAKRWPALTVTSATKEAHGDSASGYRLVISTAPLPPLGEPPLTPAALLPWATAALSRLRHAARANAATAAVRAASTNADVRVALATAGRHDAYAPVESQPRSHARLRDVVSGGRSPPITAITVADGTVIADHSRVANAFADCYEATFAAPHGARSTADDAAVEGISERWYDGLMAPVTDDELTAALADVEWTSAPGHDGIGAGVWRLLIGGATAVHRAVVAWCSACIALRHATAHSKHTVFSPIAKPSARAEGRSGAARTIADTRPIALQPALTKIVSKLLARRLSAILARHRILRGGPQYAFIRGVSAHQSVNELLDACERAMAERTAAYHVFVDFKGAFDNVRHDDIGPALRRIGAPQAYIDWTESALAGLTATVRIGAAHSRAFAVRRGVPQGGPESPLWYAIVLDSMLGFAHRSVAAHHRLHRLPSAAAAATPPAPPARPTDGKRARGRPRTRPLAISDNHENKAMRGGGAGAGDECLPVTASAYADDARLHANERAALQAVLSSVDEWAYRHSAIVSATKTIAAGTAAIPCDGEWQCIDARDELNRAASSSGGAASSSTASPVPLTLKGTAVRWKACDEVVYLGIALSLRHGGASTATIGSITRTIAAVTFAAERARLHVAVAVVAVNRYLIPKVNYRLAIARPAAATAAHWNAMTAALINRRLGLRLRPAKAAAIAAITGLVLPTHAMHVTRVSDAFARLNGRDDCGDTRSARAEFAAVADDRVVARRRYPLGRMEAVLDSLDVLGWTFTIVARAVLAATTAAFDVTERKSPPPRAIAVSDDAITAHEASKHARTEARQRWRRCGDSGDYSALRHCAAYTDGSAPASDDDSNGDCAWAVLFADEWLASAKPALEHFTEEQLIACHVLTNAPLFSGRIAAAHADGSYGAELRAIAEALWRAPEHCTLTIYTDSKSAIDAIAAWRAAGDVGRVRLRMPCRPLLREIAAAIDHRSAAVNAQRATENAVNASDGKRGGGDNGGANLPTASAGDAVTFRWVKAHTGECTLEAVANRIADATAKWRRDRRHTAAASTQIDFTGSEPWIAFHSTHNATTADTTTDSDACATADATPVPRRVTRSLSAAIATARADNERKAADEHDSERKSRPANARATAKLIAGDIRRAATKQMRAVAVKEWAASGTQARYVAHTEGAAELWRFVAGDGTPRGDDSGAAGRASASTYRGHTADCALAVRLLTDSLPYHTDQRPATRSSVWCCGHGDCAAALADEKGVHRRRRASDDDDNSARTRRSSDRTAAAQRNRRESIAMSAHESSHLPTVVVPYSTAHLFACTAPAVVAVRTSAMHRLRAIMARFACADNDAALDASQRPRVAGIELANGNGDGSVSGGDEYLRWWRSSGIAEARQSRDGHRSDAHHGTAEDAAAVAAAIGAFTATRARAAMRGDGDWNVAKEQRNDAVRALRALCSDTVRRLWRASASVRVTIDGRGFEGKVAASQGEWHGGDGDSGLFHDDDDGGGARDDDDRGDGDAHDTRHHLSDGHGRNGGAVGTHAAMADALQPNEFNDPRNDTRHRYHDMIGVAATVLASAVIAIHAHVFKIVRNATATLSGVALATVAAYAATITDTGDERHARARGAYVHGGDRCETTSAANTRSCTAVMPRFHSRRLATRAR